LNVPFVDVFLRDCLNLFIGQCGLSLHGFCTDITINTIGRQNTRLAKNSFDLRFRIDSSGTSKACCYYTFTTPKAILAILVEDERVGGYSLPTGKEGYGGEGWIRTPGTGFSQYNGLANQPALVIRSENFGLYFIPQQLSTKRSCIVCIWN